MIESRPLSMNQSTSLNESQKLTERNSRTVVKAESPATWPDYDSSEPVTKGRNYCIKIVEHRRSKSRR